MLAHGQVSEESLARHFDLSRRTLIRQLQQEGTSFHTLLKEVRLDVACVMMRDTDNSIDHIATSLGYAGASSFTRAFKTWTGQTPADWRNCHVAGPVTGSASSGMATAPGVKRLGFRA
jgi:AraC-like DNA-binding protein